MQGKENTVNHSLFFDAIADEVNGAACSVRELSTVRFHQLRRTISYF